MLIYYSNKKDPKYENGSLIFNKTKFSSTVSLTKAFYRCADLTSISAPNLTNIPENGFYYTFYGCTNLTSVLFPKVEYIGYNGFYYTFYGCTKLTSISFPNIKSNLSKYAFEYIGHSNLTIHLPASLSSSGLSTSGSSYGTIVYDL